MSQETLLNSSPSLLKSVVVDASKSLDDKEGELFNEFFQNFPKSVICVTGWDIGSSFFMRDYWYNFTFNQLKDFNLKKHYSVFFTTCNVSSIGHEDKDFESFNAWYVDIDVSGRHEVVTGEEIEERKSVALGKIFMIGTGYYKKDLPEPSFVVETRNGFHLYWLAWKETMMDENYNPYGGLHNCVCSNNFDWIEENIVKRLGGDIKACKRVQLMRVPGFVNWKDWKNGKKGVKCEILKNFDYRLENGEYRYYCEDEWMKLFGEKKQKESIIDKYKITNIEENDYKFKERALIYLYGLGEKRKDCDVFIKAAKMSQQNALLAFSGHKAVNGEVYSFRLTRSEKHLNICINGKLCSSFIDLEKNAILCRKGSGRGSPNIIEWLKWYTKYEPKNLANLLKEVLFKNAK